MTPAGLPHSEIPGSTRVNRSPRLIAACHVLRRLPMPRHPPLALSSLSIKPDKTNLINSATVYPQGPVTRYMRRPHHKTNAYATPGGFRVTLLFDYQRPSRRKNSPHPSSCGAFSRCGVLPVRLAPSGWHSLTAELFARATFSGMTS